jgi:hypothetical protein
MNIQVTDNYRITSDQHNFILERRIENKEGGKRKWKQIEFYTKLDYVFAAIREHLLRESSAKDVSALLEAVKDIDLLIDTLRHPKSTHGSSTGL